ncbi:hypothetical protein ANN_03034 [Periplaneta americana]|uniref:Transposase IS30-like HTH domain-containing protein n=1 Tax=Periplaneta americana TaxID=6978 RepID=A0ABQ8U1N8_PERAM|nr:hypothetical protein ANN_03034 [Periplaneta americana]
MRHKPKTDIQEVKIRTYDIRASFKQSDSARAHLELGAIYVRDNLLDVVVSLPDYEPEDSGFDSQLFPRNFQGYRIWNVVHPVLLLEKLVSHASNKMRHLNKFEVYHALLLLREGQSLRQVAREFDVSPSVVPRLRNRHRRTDRNVRNRPATPQTLQELGVALKEKWENIPQEEIQNLIRTVPQRCQPVIECRGGHT